MASFRGWVSLRAMKLFYSPGACSLASHIVLEEMGVNASYEKVDLRTKQTESGANFVELNPKGYVPAIQLDDGELLTENLCILPYLGDQSGTLLPKDGMARWRTIEATAFVSTELHKTFSTLFKPPSDEAAKAAKEKLAQRFALQSGWLEGKKFVMGDEMTIADAYLFVMLLWAGKFSLETTPVLQEYFGRMKERPSVQRALKAEGLS